MADESKYVVQMKTVEADAWRDIAEVCVPSRSRRRGVIEKALADAEILVPEGELVRVRVLDEDSAEVWPVEAEPQPPRLKIGGVADPTAVADAQEPLPPAA